RRATPPWTRRAPGYTASACEEEGSIGITGSASRAAAAAEAARAAPARTALSSAASATSYALTACPFFTRFASIGRPMAPVPMNPIFMDGSSLLAGYDRGVPQARQASWTAGGLILIGLAAMLC